MKYFLLLFVVVTVSASAAPQPPVPTHPSFQLDAQAKRLLVSKATSIKPGDSYQSVIKKLGKPTHDEKLAQKESDRIVGRNLSYYAVIWKDGLVNELHDELVDVFLDEHDLVKSVHIRATLK